MRIGTILDRSFLLAVCLIAAPLKAQEHPARRVATIVSVAVEEYGKAVDARGKLISVQEYQETNDFLTDAKRAAERLSGETAVSARALLDSIAAVVGFAESMTWKGKHPVVSVVETVYTKGVRLKPKEMKVWESEVVRLAGLGKWFVKIPAAVRDG